MSLIKKVQHLIIVIIAIYAIILFLDFLFISKKSEYEKSLIKNKGTQGNVSGDVKINAGKTLGKDYAHELHKREKSAEKERESDRLSAEQLIANCKQFMDKMRDASKKFNEEQERLFKQHPEIPSLREFVQNVPGEINAGTEPISESLTQYATDPKNKDIWLNALDLRRPMSLLSVLEDSTFSTYLEDLYVNAGMRESIIQSIQRWDKAANLTSSPIDPNISIQQLKQILQERRVHYEQSFKDFAEQNVIPQAYIDNLNKIANETFMVDIARSYVDSYYTGNLQKLRNQYDNFSDRFNEALSRIQNNELKASLINEFRKIPSPYAGM